MTRLSRITTPRATGAAFALLAVVMLALGLFAEGGQHGGAVASADGATLRLLLHLCLGN